ncbi:MAG: hypothetical protein SWH68_00340 [Thermodesulfobacteriota bacterium]|nr:hypothetical protein [Thermodesulfobacteriota bacterium]
MKRHSKYSLLGLQALHRASAKVSENARRNNYKLPVWENGKIIYVEPGSATGHPTSSPDTPEFRECPFK